MLRLKARNIINNSLVSKFKKAIIEETYKEYKRTTKNYINTMHIYPQVHNSVSNDYNLRDTAVNELIAEHQIEIKHDSNDGNTYIVLSDKVISENSHDYLSKTAFIKKYRSEIIAIFALLVSAGSLVVSIIALLQKLN